MAGTLATLKRVHELKADERRKALALARQRREAVLAARKELDRDLAAEEAFALAEPMVAALTFARFAQAAGERRARLGAALVQASTVEDAHQEALGEAFRTLKTTERLLQTQHERARAEAGRREQAAADEMAVLRFARDAGTG
jgi:flagellar export protein FliJ